MSLGPLLFSDWWEELDHPHRLFDQNFGLSLDADDLIERLVPSRTEMLVYKPTSTNRPLRSRIGHYNNYPRYHPFLRNLARRANNGKGVSTLSPDKDKFQMTLDVQQFHPEEINVKVVDNHVVVEAKHEEKEDEHGWISRQFTRKYLVPNQCDIEKLESHLSSDGVLTITAPKKQPQKPESNEKVIKIQLTGQPAIVSRGDENANSSDANKEQQQQRQQAAAQRAKKSTVKAA